ncbi:MAG: sulfatase-like hydrolase/transferase [Bacteroidetes bacterium]|nr:sulfatase-like hydrolase/transferase [Bacteroidota bacterium]
MIKLFKKLIYLITLLFILSSVSAQRNVILIIADDLGTDYCGFYENHLDTVNLPNVRRLLAKGVRFKNAWSNPLCSPTRAGILTGRYSFRTGVGDAVGGVGSAVLDTSEITIPRILNIFTPNGIAKANIGKWHLHSPMPKSNLFLPNTMGYDHFEGNFIGMLNSYFDWTKVTNGISNNVTNYATTETINNAIAWIKKQNNKPFFLWLAFNAPHTPYHLPPLNLHSYSGLSGTDADITANPKAYFKAMNEAMDHEIGRLFDSLQVIKKYDSTDIIFIGDNGNDKLVSQNSGSAKGSIYQEGVSVPFIISGPSIINPNRSSEALVSTHDLFATIIELYGYDNWKSQIPVNKPVDSKSIIPILKDKSNDVRSWVFTEVFKNPTVTGDGKTIRNKTYKLLDFDNGSQEFYNLKNDPNENKNLLSGTMNSEEINNYNELCSEMTTLIGNGLHCKNISGVQNNEDSSMVTEYPNPFTSYIFLPNSTGNEVFELSNNLGQIVFKGKHIELQNFSNLIKGNYILKVEGNSSMILKLIKE